MTNIYDTMTSMSGLAGAKAGPDLSSTAAAVPIDPAAEKAALEWLDNRCDPNRCFESAPACTLRAMLALPRLPAEPSGEALGAIYAAMYEPKPANRSAAIYRALYAHLTAPKTKTVWCVSWGTKDESVQCPDLRSAMALVDDTLRENATRVSVERREVLND